MTQIHAVYFSYNKHFWILLCSLQSLKRLEIPFIGNIYIYYDRTGPFSKKQWNLLRQIYPNLIARRSRFRLRRGLDRICSELIAFKEINSEIGGDDYLVKLDSDILFLSDNIFKVVIESEMDLVGQYPNVAIPKFKYTQGGCYFMSNRIISKMIRTSFFKTVMKTTRIMKREVPKPHLRASWRWLPEDAFMYNLMEQNTNKIQFIDFYFPVAARWGKITLEDRERYSVIHFERRYNKRQMLKCFKRLFNCNLRYELNHQHLTRYL
jgi:hypothetical protein